MRAFYCDTFVLPLPEGHRFPMAKYRLLREALVAQGVLTPGDLAVPAAASDAELARAHLPAYVERATCGRLEREEVRRIGFPWSPEMVERSRRSAGATLEACRAAFTDGFAANLAGGTHHAFADHGEGFCMFNDAAVAARVFLAEGRVGRVVVLDCDVHQGNGTAAIFRDDPRVFTFSIHGAKNYPFHKEASDLDVELADRAGDGDYLSALAAALPTVFAAPFDLAIYVAGSDPFHDDRLGRLALTKAGLEARDRLVLGACRERGIPVAVTMAGGYARNIADTVEIHATTVRVAAELAS